MAIDTRRLWGGGIGLLLGGPVGAAIGYSVTPEILRLGRSLDPTTPPPKFTPPPSAQTPPPPYSQYVPSPESFPVYQAPSSEELQQRGARYVKALEQEFGYRGVEDLRRQALQAQRQLFNEELQRANALTATAMAGQGVATSPAYGAALGRNVALMMPRLAQAQYQIETDYRDALMRELAAREALASQEYERQYGKSIQDYLLSQYAPFQYRVSYGRERYGYEGLLPWQTSREAGMQQSLLDYLGQLGAYQGKMGLWSSLLGGLGSAGGTALGIGLGRVI